MARFAALRNISSSVEVQWGFRNISRPAQSCMSTLQGACAAVSVEGPRTVQRPRVDVEPETDTSVDRLWNVIVWNDPINLMSYVTFVFQKLFGYALEVATRLMLEVHHRGRSIVASVERERAEYYVTRLHQYGLQATLEKQTG